MRMIARHTFRFFVFLTALLLLYTCFPQLYQWGDYVRQTNPFSGQKYVEQAFEATEDEKACWEGRPLPSFVAPPELSELVSEPIPKVVHFIFGLKNPLYTPGAGRFDFLTYLAVRSAIVSIKPDVLYLHYTYLSHPPSADPNADPHTNEWIRRLAKDITLVHHAPDESTSQYAHLSDIMRLEFLRDQGGIYLDIDAFALRPFDNLLLAQPPHDIILGHEGGNRAGLCNAIIVARPNSTFVQRWLDSYKTADLSREWNYHSVLLPKEMQIQHPEEVCTLAPDAFFWPTWTWRHVEWMHTPLSRSQAAGWRAKIKENGGSLFKHQLAYHAWNQMAYDRYLRHLTPTIVRMQDTRFNLLVRRFLEDDL